MRVQQFEPADAAEVAGWALTPEQARRWCSRETVTAADVTAWSGEPGVAAYLLRDGDTPVAYGELWIDEDEVELARLIVAPAHRGRGVGRRLVAALVERALAHHPAIFMRVRPDNTPALRCYAASGFRPVPQSDADAWNRAQPVPYVWLHYTS